MSNEFRDRLKQMEEDAIQGEPDYPVRSKQPSMATGDRETDAILVSKAGYKPTAKNVRNQAAAIKAANPIAAIQQIPLQELLEDIAEIGPRETAHKVGVSAIQLIVFMRADPSRQEQYESTLAAAADIMMMDSLDVAAEGKYKGKRVSKRVDNGLLIKTLHATSGRLGRHKTADKRPPVIVNQFQGVVPASGKIHNDNAHIIDQVQELPQLGDGSEMEEI